MSINTKYAGPMLYRGKKTISKGWSTGSYYIENENIGVLPINGYIQFHVIKEGTNRDCRIFKIDPSTLCAWTGLTDVNGIKIFAGDIISANDYDTGKSMFVIEWDCVGSSFYAENLKDSEEKHMIEHLSYVAVIGNVFDNPELLEPEDWK